MPTTIVQTADARRIKATVPAGEVSPPLYVRPECVVTGIPGASGTVLVEATWSSQADVAAGTATWFPWDAGVASTKDVQLLEFATAVRFTAATAAAVCEVGQ
jgi:hypothetical protein